MRILRTMVKTKRATNLNLPTVLVKVSESYAAANGRNMSELVAQLLRDFLEERQIPCEADLADIISQLRKRSREQESVTIEDVGRAAERLTDARAESKTKQAARKRAA